MTGFALLYPSHLTTNQTSIAVIPDDSTDISCMPEKTFHHRFDRFTALTPSCRHARGRSWKLFSEIQAAFDLAPSDDKEPLPTIEEALDYLRTATCENDLRRQSDVHDQSFIRRSERIARLKKMRQCGKLGIECRTEFDATK